MLTITQFHKQSGVQRKYIYQKIKDKIIIPTIIGGITFIPKEYLTQVDTIFRKDSRREANIKTA